MRFKWDDKKSKILNDDRRRGLSFERVSGIFKQQYFLDQKSDEPEQFRAIGFVDEKLITLIFEVREDGYGEFYHFVTYWPSTKAERKLYEEG
jgi:uncharacterized DUF497 family protein